MKKIVIGLFLTLIPMVAICAIKTDRTIFPSAKRDIEAILSNKIFKKYADFTVTNIRQGAVGEAMTYFVTLKQPFQSEPAEICFMFQSKESSRWDLAGKPGDCKN